MNAKSLKCLEFQKITEMLKQYAVSPIAKEKSAAITPLADLADITRAQKQTSEAASLILKKGSLPLGGIKDIRAAIARASAGGILAAEDFLEISGCLYVFGKLQNYATDAEFVFLQNYFSCIAVCEPLEREITRCVKDSGEISDNASAKLSEIRRSIRKSHDNIRDKLDGIIRSAQYKTMLQDAIITLRGERFCVPVKAEFAGSFPGMMHDRSSTGATVFIEPLAVVELNNKIRELHLDEKREIEKILQKLSGLVWENAEVLDANLAIATELDFIFARGELSLRMKASEPVFNQRGYVNIRKGRHPLLVGEVVPTDIELGGEFSMLLITGPNTGGKTVTLKTVGLFTLMGQAGLHIPAMDNSELAVFDEVFADIGDEQSIEQSLSTFSSHLTNIVAILENLAPNALVLLDELGAGTDPTEGAALAMALLSYLHARKIRTVVTTHYSELKLYALSTDGVENASCEFDLQTLRPTYRLLVGIPGKSNAFAIAKRLGLPDEIISDARALLSQKDIRFEDVITDLEASKKQVLIEQERAAVYARDAEKLRADAAKLEEKLRTQKEKILQNAQEDAMALIRDAKKQAQEILAEMREISKSGELESARKKMREGFGAMESAAAPAMQKPERKPPENLRPGDRVFIHSLNSSGTITSPPDSSGETQIQAGIMKIKVHVSDLSLDEEDASQKAEKFIKKRHSGGGLKSLAIPHELDLRGLLPEEAVIQSERYIDEAFLGNLPSATLIHGKGTGVLRTAIHNMLKRQPNVKDFRLGKFGEGEDGVTIVTFK